MVLILVSLVNNILESDMSSLNSTGDQTVPEALSPLNRHVEIQEIRPMVSDHAAGF